MSCHNVDLLNESRLLGWNRKALVAERLHEATSATLIHRSRLFFEDLPNIHGRRERRAYNEVLSTETRGKRPRYYLQKFHFQSGGWMADDSAERYDTQVEVLLNGAANAIRRQALPQLHEAFAGRDQRKLRLLDILVAAPGDSSISLSRPGRALQTIGLDMSEAYLKHAQHHLKALDADRLRCGQGRSDTATR